MIIYNSKSEECLKLLEKSGIGDYWYQKSCSLLLGDVVFDAFAYLWLGILLIIMYKFLKKL